ncbi:MAG: exodeoxyribonuclease III [Gemmatimonadetes bacterium]|nr:exodeoxyribonuclease III [Gemmatimonadota bacterium]
MRIATWNVNGIRARAAQLAEWLERDRPDVVCLQELKAEVGQIPEEVKRADYHAYWHCRKGYSGVALLIRKELSPALPVFAHPAFDMESRIVQAEYDGLIIASVYVPNGGKDYPAKLGFVRDLVEWAKALQSDARPLVLCGDINIAHTDMDVHPKERKADAIGQRREERDLFDALLGAGLVDTGRALNPDNGEMFSWWAPWRNLRARNIGWRIDYVLASNSTAARATGCVVQAAVGTSDHAPVVTTLGG